jgi:sugar phosphate isomerase/epimerase
MRTFLSTRRAVLATLVTTLIAMSCAGPGPSSCLGDENNPKDSYTIGLSMYSLRQLFADGSLHAFDYPAFARDKFGITDIDVWDGAFPADRKTDPEFYKELRAHADKAGSHIFLLMAGAMDVNNAKTPKVQQVPKEDFFAAVDRAVLLGAKYVRVFLKVPNEEREIAINDTMKAITPLADYAKSKGVVIVIEPGASDWAKKGTFLAEVAKKMNHPACRLMPDFGKMKDDDPYGGTEAMMPYTDVVSAKSHNFDAQGNEVDFDYERLMRTIKDAGFRGIVAIEYEGKELPPVEGVEATQKLLQRLR